MWRRTFLCWCFILNVIEMLYAYVDSVLLSSSLHCLDFIGCVSDWEMLMCIHMRSACVISECWCWCWRCCRTGTVTITSSIWLAFGVERTFVGWLCLFGLLLLLTHCFFLLLVCVHSAPFKKLKLIRMSGDQMFDVYYVSACLSFGMWVCVCERVFHFLFGMYRCVSFFRSTRSINIAWNIQTISVKWTQCQSAWQVNKYLSSK